LTVFGEKMIAVCWRHNPAAMWCDLNRNFSTNFNRYF